MNQKGSSIIAGAIIILLIAVGVAAVVYWEATYDVGTYQITGTVKKMAIVPSGNKDNPVSYVIWLTGGEKLEVKSNLWHNVNEDDLWVQINEGNAYTFICWGYHLEVPAFGIYWYPNVVGIKLV